MVLFLGVIIPPLIPWYFFNEEFASAWYATVCARITFSQNFTFTVNSLAHLYGYQPYDKCVLVSFAKSCGLSENYCDFVLLWS